jgi:K+/H+ antiporter YhaU regulatory subunit KhtT
VDKKEMVVYVKLEEYKEISEIINLIKARLKQAGYILGKISDLKKQEDAEIESWVSELDNVEERVDAIDKTLSEPEI